jgi:hypothetical protein
MPLFKRSDGTLLTKLHPFRVLNPLLMRSRTEATIFIPTQVDVTHTLEYLEELSDRVGEKVTIFNVVLCAIARVVALRPELNRFINGTDIYQRNRIQLAFIAKKVKREKARESNVKMTFSPYETIFTIMDKLKQELTVVRSEEGNKTDKETMKFGSLPKFLLKFLIGAFRFLDRHNLAPADMIASDPLYCSAYVTNMGSLGMERGPYHHLFEWGNASLFLGISKHGKRPVVDETGNIVAREIMDIVVTYDDRISEGLYGVRAIELMKSFIEHPEQLEQPPDIPPEILEELKLVPWEKPAKEVKK